MQLHRARDRFAAAGARLVLIGQAGPRQAAHFRRRLGLELPVLADHDRASYTAAGARRGGVLDLVGPRSALSAVKHVARSGQLQGRPVGDVTQLGGAMVIAQGGDVRLSRMAEHAGDNAGVDVLLDALAGTPAG